MLSWLVTLVSVLAFVLANHDDSPGQMNKERRTLCEKNDDGLYNELENCFQMEAKAIRDATADCAKEAVPKSDGNTIAFFKAACKEHQAFAQFDDCFQEYEANPAFKKQMEITPETEACYNAVFKKYNVEELSTVLEKSHATHE